MPPKISIVLPAYNSASCVHQTIQSIISQSFQDWELIVIDDGSIDNTFQILQKFESSDNRIKIFKQDNLGPSQARNLGLEKCVGDYIAFIDADDTIGMNYISQLLEGFQKFPSSDLVCCGFKEFSTFHPNGIALNDFELFRPKRTISKDVFLDIVFSGLTGVLWAKLFKASIIKKQNLKLNADIKLSEDLVFVVQYVKHCQDISIVYSSDYHYNRIQESGLSSNLDTSYLKGLKIFNENVLNEFRLMGWEMTHIKKKLDVKTSNLVVKILGNYNQSSAALKKAYNNILNYFRNNEINKQSDVFNRIYFWFISKKMFLIARVYCRLLMKLKKVKREKKIFS